MKKPLLAEDQLVDVPGNPLPKGAVCGVIQTRDGIGIRYALWKPSQRPRNGTAVILQGRAEFIEKYSETISNLLGRDYAVVAFDWRGQGGSQKLLSNPRRGHVSSFSHYLIDLETVMQEIVLPDCLEPFHCIAHSAGATVALLYASRARTQFSRMILSAPLLDLHHHSGKTKRILTRIATLLGLGRMYVPGGSGSLVQLTPFEGNVLTSDPVRFERMVATVSALPRLGLGSPTIAWLNAAMQAFRTVESPKFARQVGIPVLMIAPGKDIVVSNGAIERLTGRLKTAGLVRIPGAKHEVLLERDPFREQFWAAFDAFTGLPE